jgi:hypothetical protein
VTLLDASESPGGLSSAFTTPGGQLVEPGIKGFWYQVCGMCLQVKCVVIFNCMCCSLVVCCCTSLRLSANLPYAPLHLHSSEPPPPPRPLQYCNIEALVKELGIPSCRLLHAAGPHPHLSTKLLCSTSAVCCLLPNPPPLAPTQYCNIEALVKELGIPSPFTPFTRSSFWTPEGLQVRGNNNRPGARCRGRGHGIGARAVA